MLSHSSDHSRFSASGRNSHKDSSGGSLDEDSLDGSSVGSRRSFWRRSSAKREGVPLNVAVKEHRRVALSKSVMIFILMIVAAGFCAATFLLLKKEEEDDFARQFENYASEIVAVATEHVETTFVAISAFAKTVASNALDAGETWPNVTLPHFGAQAESIAKLAAGADIVTTAIVVEGSERLSFEAFAREHVQGMLQESLDYQNIDMNATDLGVPDKISYLNITSKQTLQEPEGGDGPYVVNWQRYPYVTTKVRTMNNLLRVPTIRSAVVAANATLSPKLAFFEGVRGVSSQVIQPIFEEIYAPHEDSSSRKMVGVVWLILDWSTYFGNLLPEGVNGTTLVLKSSCGFESTYIINGLEAEFQGLEDLHDSNFDDMEVAADFFSFGEQEDYPSNDVCIDQLTLHLYPSNVLKDANTTNKPAIYTAVVAAIFLFVSLVFLVYDWMVQSRQRKVMDRVITQDKIVSNLFPATIRDRLYRIGDRAANGDLASMGDSSSASTHGMTSSGVDMNDTDSPEIYGAKPIADLFLETTVIFADISGFTAWSSAREPSQVFRLLESIYSTFDRLAARHGVFKVETIGDCYVAVAGLPIPNKDHAILAAKFARDCMEKMGVLTAKLEIGLGPDTGDLHLRIGLNSGQVTAGVLRGERSRFQLFGDTVNVAARMESSGVPGKIQLSGFTADLLKQQGRSKWVKPRGEVLIHGKGTLDTFWLETKAESAARMEALRVAQAMAEISEKKRTGTGVDTEDTERSDAWSEEDDELCARGPALSRKERLVEWNVEILGDLLKRILAARNKKPNTMSKTELEVTRGDTVLEEFEEIITLPKVTMNDLKRRKDPDYIMLDEKVIGQLRGLLSEIADLYRDNSFHSFEHASHVTASVAKLLSRIVTSDTTNQTHGPNDIEATDLAGHSYGITSDPLTQFAVVFSAIIHDADHPGVPNAQLVKEKDPWATRYKGKSLAEQNSVDLVWAILLQPKYVDLRACIYADETELKRFRQLIVNVVMATDIADKELGALRKARWHKAFDPAASEADQDLAVNRKATIVLEHLIQASDVSHTMQHWQVYKKWNEKYFVECYAAWKAGRADQDPSLGWYEGEIGFFDFYIIPLAKKLDSCGVFGVCSHEYLNYATANRDEWKRKGSDIVRGYVESYEAQQAV